MASTATRLLNNIARVNFKSVYETITSINFYNGGFEKKMSRREACLILGISSSSPANRVREIHRRLMLINHPDRGGSPLIASKINEAKDILIKNRS